MTWNDLASPAREKQGWSAVEQGLHFVVIGYIALCVGCLSAFALSELARRPNLDAAFLQFVSSVVAALSGIIFFALLFSGQWRCTRFTPASCNVREYMFACTIFLAVAASMCLCYLGVLFWPESPQAARRSIREDLDQLSIVAAVIVGSLLVLNYLIFNHYLQVLRGWFDSQSSDSTVDCFFLFASLLIGCTVGLALHWSLIPEKQLVIATLTVGWVGCFGWHVQRIISLRRLISDRINQPEEQVVQVDSYTPTKGLSGIRRALRI